MCILIRGAGRETSQRVSTKLQKTPKKLHFLLTTPQKYDIISISRIMTTSFAHFVLALHFRTSFRYCTGALAQCIPEKPCFKGFRAFLPSFAGSQSLYLWGSLRKDPPNQKSSSFFKKILTWVKEYDKMGAAKRVKVIHRIPTVN